MIQPRKGKLSLPVGLLRFPFRRGTWRFDARAALGLHFLVVLVPHGVFHRIHALLLGEMALRQCSAIPHAEFVQGELVFLGNLGHIRKRAIWPLRGIARFSYGRYRSSCCAPRQSRRSPGR